uniref:Protein LBH n=1 Tax=Felis catus TaxID=9685 RepID=A0ABI7WQH8_FELCA
MFEGQGVLGAWARGSDGPGLESHSTTTHFQAVWLGQPPSSNLRFFKIFPDPSDFDRSCKVKDRLPSIVVEPTEGEVESGELRWPPEEFVVQEDEQDNCEDTEKDNKEQ